MQNNSKNISPMMFPQQTKFNSKFSGYFAQPCCRTKVPQWLVVASAFEASNWLADRFTMSGVTLDPQIFSNSRIDADSSSQCLADSLGLDVVPAFEIISPVLALNEATITHTFLLLLDKVAGDDRSGSFIDEFLEMGKIFNQQSIVNQNNTVNFGLHFRTSCRNLELFTSLLRKEKSAQRRQLIELYLQILCLVGLVELPDQEAIPEELIFVASELIKIRKYFVEKHQMAIASDYCYLKFINYDLWMRVV